MIPTAYPFQIRPMTEEDVSAVAAMEAMIFNDAWSETLYRETIQSGRYDCQVLLVEDTLVGYFCGQVILDEAEVHRIAVDPSWRGHGYGQLLLAEFLDRVKGLGVISVLLEVRAGNVAAIGLYEKNGFETIGRRKEYYQKPKEDALILQCQI